MIKNIDTKVKLNRTENDNNSKKAKNTNENTNENNNNLENKNSTPSENGKPPERAVHTIMINSQLKLVEVKPTAAAFLFRLINENRHSMNEHIPYFQRIQGINDVVDFIKEKMVKVVETYYLYALLNSKGKTNSNDKTVETPIPIEKYFLYFINYEKIPVGVIGLSNIDWYNHSGELHFWTATLFQKRGFMTKALSAMLNFLFYDVRLNRIFVKLRLTNNPGKLLLKRFGFTLEGIERQSFFYIPEKDPSKNNENKSKIQSIKEQRRNKSEKENDNGTYYDLCVYSLISRDYI